MTETITKEFIFKYSATGKDEGPFSILKAPLKIPTLLSPMDKYPKELAQRLISMFHVPVYLEEELEQSLEKFIKTENKEFYDKNDDLLIEKAKNGDTDIESVIKNWEKLFKEETVEFSDRRGASDEEVFADAYHRLVHSPVLDAILKTESAYTRSVQEVIQQRDTDVHKMTDNQAAEMEDKMRLLHTFTTEDEINHLAGRHFEEQSLVAGRWGSQLDALKQAQRAEYRSWLMKTLEDHQTNSEVQTPSSPLNQFAQLEIGDSATASNTQMDNIMEESFTIHLGPQLKQMHNIRILSADVMRFCKIKQSDDRIIDASRRLQTAIGLYSSDLCGLVILTETPPPHYTGLSKDIDVVCQQSTEFHFTQMDHQIDKIIESVKEPVLLRNAQRVKNQEANQTDSSNHRKVKESKNLQPGDVYITKHSNLAEVHVLFHLIADDSCLKFGDINSRHPAILGLRNILKTACSNDITTITLPLLLRHDMSEEMTVAWCAKRAELVFKCVKGFMIEMASWGGSELKNIQFLVPAGISEEVFSTLASMLPSIFRVSNPLKFNSNTQS